jgi:hypothetical protein
MATLPKYKPGPGWSKDKKTGTWLPHYFLTQDFGGAGLVSLVCKVLAVLNSRWRSRFRHRDHEHAASERSEPSRHVCNRARNRCWRSRQRVSDGLLWLRSEPAASDSLRDRVGTGAHPTGLTPRIRRHPSCVDWDARQIAHGTNEHAGPKIITPFTHQPSDLVVCERRNP